MPLASWVKDKLLCLELNRGSPPSKSNPHNTCPKWDAGPSPHHTCRPQPLHSLGVTSFMKHSFSDGITHTDSSFSPRICIKNLLHSRSRAGSFLPILLIHHCLSITFNALISVLLSPCVTSLYLWERLAKVLLTSRRWCAV